MNRLKELRQQNGMTQKEFSIDFGVPVRTLQTWEKGESQIKPEKAQQLADYFDVSLAYLLGYSEYENEFQALKELEKKHLGEWTNGVKARIISLIGREGFDKLEKQYVQYDGFSADYENFIALLSALNSLQRTDEEKLLLYFGLLSKGSRQSILNISADLASIEPRLHSSVEK